MSVNITNEDINEILGTNVADNTSSGNTFIADSDNTENNNDSVQDEHTNNVDIKILSDYGVSAMASRRYSGAPWFKACSEINVEVVGAGGISSWTVLALSRLNLKGIYIIDDDEVSAYNMAGQFFGPMNIGGHKVSELVNNVKLFSPNINMNMSRSRFYSDTSIRKYIDIIITGVDLMASRWAVYNSAKASGFTGLYIDGRLSADTLQVICFRFDDIKSRRRYEENYMFNDMDADITICSFKQTTYMAMMIGSVICNLVVNYANNKVNLVEYNLPFFTEYNSIKMSLEELR